MSRSLHVVASLAREHGGPSYSVPRLCATLVEQGGEVSLVSIEQGEPTGLFPARLFKQDFQNVPGLAQLRLSNSLQRHLNEAAGKVEVVHNHGLWLAPNTYAGRAALRNGTPLVVSPRGMLAEGALRYSRLKKKLVWALAQDRALREAAGWHATSERELEDIRQFDVPRRPVAVIPNGVDLPLQTARHEPDKAERILLFLSRVHPKKGLADLVTAWSRLAPSFPEWRVVIAGPDEVGHTAQLQRQCEALGVERISFPGPAYGKERDALMASADLYVLPTQSENFGIAVAEALGAKLPAIVTRGAPWKGLHDNDCGWWIEAGVDPLETALREAMQLPAPRRQEMGQKGRGWVEEAFSWTAVGTQMEKFYRWLTGRGDRPDFVSI